MILFVSRIIPSARDPFRYNSNKSHPGHIMWTMTFGNRQANEHWVGLTSEVVIKMGLVYGVGRVHIIQICHNKREDYQHYTEG